jgi:hypothetical protein
MIRKILALSILPFFIGIMLFINSESTAEEPKLFIPDKALCAKMLRFGKQSYQRGKYLDAKEYFRKAVQADPQSEVAWHYYDLAAVFALAEKVEKNAELLTPEVSTRSEGGSGPPPPSSPTAKPAREKEKVEFKIVDDEGC